MAHTSKLNTQNGKRIRNSPVIFIGKGNSRPACATWTHPRLAGRSINKVDTRHHPHLTSLLQGTNIHKAFWGMLLDLSIMSDLFVQEIKPKKRYFQNSGQGHTQICTKWLTTRLQSGVTYDIHYQIYSFWGVRDSEIWLKWWALLPEEWHSGGFSQHLQRTHGSIENQHFPGD